MTAIFSPNMDFFQRKWNDNAPYILIFLFALFVRGVYLWEIKTAAVPIFSLLVGDAEYYDLWAQSISKGDWIGKEVFYQAPFYPYFLGVIYALFGRSFLLVKSIQLLIGSLSCVFLAVAGNRFFSKKAGLIAGLLLAVYPSAIFFDALIQKSVFNMFFMAITLMMIGNNLSKPRYGSLFFIGIILGCFSLTRENAMVLFLVIFLWLWFGFENESKGKRVLYTMLVFLGAAIVFLPVAFRNKIVGNEFLITTSNFGTNLYIGNNLDADGKYKPILYGRGNWRFERKDSTEIAEKVTGRQLSPSEVSRFWTKRVYSFISENPVTWLRLMVKKFTLVWSATEVADTESIYGYSLISALLRTLNSIFHFGILFPLAVFGACMSWKLRKKIWVLYVILILYASSVALFFIFSRYRYPVAAILILFAAIGISRIQHFLQLFPNRKSIAIIGAVCLSGIFSNCGIYSLENTRIVALYNWDKTVSLQKAKIETLYNTGKEYYLSGKIKEAIECFQEVILLDPNTVKAYGGLGNALLDNGQIQEAVIQYRKALNLDAAQADVHNHLGWALLTEGETESAQFHFKEALRLQPAFPSAQNNLDIALKFKNKPNDPDLYFITGEIYRKAGLTQQAITQYRKVLSMKPKFIPALISLAVIHAEKGDLDNSIRFFKKVTEIKPEKANAYYNIACIYARKNNPDESIKWLKKSISKGYDNYERIRTDKDLSLIRDSMAYKNLILSFEKDRS